MQIFVICQPTAALSNVDLARHCVSHFDDTEYLFDKNCKYSIISGSVCENADQIQYTSLVLLSNLLLQSLPPSLNSHLIQQCASSVTFPRETPKRKLYQSKARKILPKCEGKKTYWRKGTTKSGLAAYLEIFVSYNIKRSLSSRTQRKNLARMQYLEMFPRQNALSASCKASLKHSHYLLQSSQILHR